MDGLKMSFLLGWSIFRCEVLVSGSVITQSPPIQKWPALPNNSVRHAHTQEGGNYSVTYTVSDPQVIRLVGFSWWWWFQIFFYVHPEPWGRFPMWLIFFKGVETTNQFSFGMCFSCKSCDLRELKRSRNWRFGLGKGYDSILLTIPYLFYRNYCNPWW